MPITKTVMKQTPFKFGMVNAQSCRNKTVSIKEYVIEKDLDLFVIIESWLFTHDKEKIAKLQPEGYGFEHLPRDDRQGGGIALLYKSNVSVIITQKEILGSCEYIDSFVKYNSKSMRLISIYRPENDKKKKKILISLFFEEFSDIVEQYILSKEDLLIVGDFNFHISMYMMTLMLSNSWNY